MHTPTNHRFSFSHVILTRACLPALITIACIGAACGGGGGEGETDDTGGDVKPGYFPGYVVDCLPESPKESLVCIPKPDWDCAVRGHYFRESICANILGGTPGGYDEKPEIVKFDPDGAGPEEPTSDIYCDNPPEGVLWNDQGPAPCTDCNVCTMQLQGYYKWGFQQGYGWDEYAWCPGTYDEIAEEICDGGGPMDPPTTGGDDDGGMGGTGIWKCMGSWTISGTMNETSLPQSSTEIFMSPNGIPDCVNATDESDAETMCSSLCQTKNEIYEQEANNSASKNWVPFNCGDLDAFTPVEASDPSECSGGGPMALTDPVPFTANATLKIGGTTTRSDQLGGLMEFTIEECPVTRQSCDVSITEIRADARTVHGVHTDSSGAPLSFTIADLEVRMLQPVLGQWERTTGIVTFPGKDLFATISTGEITLDGAPLSSGLDRSLFEVEGAHGTWDGRQLALDLPWRKDGLSLSLQINAR